MLIIVINHKMRRERCKISDIYFGFGNIVIFTDENFRNQGLATTLLNLLLIKCE